MVPFANPAPALSASTRNRCSVQSLLNDDLPSGVCWGSGSLSSSSSVGLDGAPFSEDHAGSSDEFSQGDACDFVRPPSPLRSMSAEDLAVLMTDTGLQTATRDILSKVEHVRLPKVIADRAIDYCCQLFQKKAFRGHQQSSNFVGACILIACRKEGHPFTFKEVCAITKVSKKELGRTCKFALKVLGTSLDPISTEQFMTRFCKSLHLSEMHTRLAATVARRAYETTGIAGRCPLSIAAASIYMVCLACGLSTHRRDIADVVGVAEVTISNSYRLMHPSRHQLFHGLSGYQAAIESLPLL